MLAVISPAKKLDFETLPHHSNFSQPAFLDRSELLVQKARLLSRTDLSQSMKLSDKLSDLNYQRFKKFSTPFTVENAKQAALVFNGDTYLGLEATTLQSADFEFAQNHLRILSGLYGLLRPLDLIQPYRLEMGAKFKPPSGNNLYEFWNVSIANKINDTTDSHKDQTIINLASIEYFKAVDQATLKGNVITPVFKEVKNDISKIISFYAKRARGRMARYIIKNRLNKPEQLKEFKEEGYKYCSNLSKGNNWVFTRDKQTEEA